MQIDENGFIAGTNADSSRTDEIISVSQHSSKPNVVRRFKCWLGFHDWVNIDTNPMPNPKAGEMICWSDLHECEHCKKQEYKGMGCVV
jgi:hypothetical protein